MPRTIDPRSAASHPGGLELSTDRLRSLEPELFASRWRPGHARRQWTIRGVREHLLLGDSRAAVVIGLNPLRVAAYTDEFDCSVVVEFPVPAGQDLDLSVGSRLLTVNTYAPAGPFAPDLIHGPRSIRRWHNVFPLIAELLVPDPSLTVRRKEAISEREWIRASGAAEVYLRHTRGRCRDGRPTRSGDPVAV